MAAAQSSGPSTKKSKLAFDLRMSATPEGKTQLYSQLHKIKDIIAESDQKQPPTTYDTLMEVFGHWLKTAVSGSDSEEDQPRRSATPTTSGPRQSSFQMLNKQESKQEQIHLVSRKSLEELGSVIHSHRDKCPGTFNFDSDITAVGFWNRMTLSCTRRQCAFYSTGKYKWSTSTYVSGRDSYVNNRIMHAANVAGLLPSQLKVFTKTANISGIVDRFLKPAAPLYSKYINSVTQVGHYIHYCFFMIIYLQSRNSNNFYI